MTVAELKQRVRGPGAITMTPFMRNLEIDFRAIQANTVEMIDRGAAFLVPTGGTSESKSMSDGEIKEVMTAHIEAAEKRVPVFPGVMRNDYKSCIELTAHAKSAGADGVMLLMPEHYSASADAVVEFYRVVKQEAELPVMLYVHGNVNLTPDLMQRLLQLGHVCSIKLGGDLSRFQLLVEQFTDDLSILCTGEENALFCFILGAPGSITVTPNFAPQVLQKMLDLVHQEELKEATALFGRFLRFRRMRQSLSTSAMTKAAMTICGMQGGRVRPPLRDADREEMKQLEKILRDDLHAI